MQAYRSNRQPTTTIYFPTINNGNENMRIRQQTKRFDATQKNRFSFLSKG